MCQSEVVDVRTWIRDELTLFSERLQGAVVAHVPDELWRTSLPAAVDGGPRSATIAGLLFHLSYHHDLAVSTAVLDRPPLLGQWRGRLGIEDFEPEIGLSEQPDGRLVDALDLDALRAYAAQVGAATDLWATRVAAVALDTIPAASRRLAQRAGVRQEVVPWLHAMWDRKPVAWLVQWEALAHPITHLGEMVAVRNQLGLSPF